MNRHQRNKIFKSASGQSDRIQETVLAREKFSNHLGKQPTSFGNYERMLPALRNTILNSELFHSNKQVENKRLFLF
jgi:hypothetical protein